VDLPIKNGDFPKNKEGNQGKMGVLIGSFDIICCSVEKVLLLGVRSINWKYA
jgi:hypothetical protein